MNEEQAMTELRAAVRRHKAAQKRLDAAQAELKDALRTASDAGARQVDLVKVTGYTREHVRRLLKPATEN